MQSMMCADSLALANSTLLHLVAFHTSAVRVYVPKACNEEAQGIATAYPNKKVCLGTRTELLANVSGRDCYHSNCIYPWPSTPLTGAFMLI